MPKPTPSQLGFTATRCWRENKLLRTERGEEALLSWKLGEHGADDCGEETTAAHSKLEDGFGSKPMTTRGAQEGVGEGSLIVGFSFSLGFSGRGENSWEKLPEPNCDTLAVRVNARGLFPVIFDELDFSVLSRKILDPPIDILNS